MKESEIRQAIIDEAKTWAGTPWHHEGRVKYAGVDCGMFLLEVYEKVGLIPHIRPDHYNMDFMCHRSEEWFLETILQYADEIADPPYLPGDVIMFQQGRLYSHSGIIIEWPEIIHACAQAQCVTYADMNLSPLSERKRKIFRYKDFI
jgi:cell wall-associated NlpC family hydrolase